MVAPVKSKVDGPSGTVRTLTIGKALNLGLRAAMEADDKVIMMGEDVGKLGGVFRITDGLQKDFGENRVLDTPLAESGIIGTAVGLAVRGFRPVSADREADRGADDAGLGERGVEHPRFAEVLLQAVRDPEDAAELADVLAHDDDLGVVLHGLAQPLGQRLGQRVGRHQWAPSKEER